MQRLESVVIIASDNPSASLSVDADGTKAGRMDALDDLKRRRSAAQRDGDLEALELLSVLEAAAEDYWGLYGERNLIPDGLARWLRPPAPKRGRGRPRRVDLTAEQLAAETQEQRTLRLNREAQRRYKAKKRQQRREAGMTK